ncbi:VOC family protein [Catenuloplanes atrovinosus]|uniref:Catechol 2,3-dioxygenase-like lactoylglutathione lyase family enzyme n=1 Tax=Catenuloplanes atrovinosus TaxID=137266 RepID=A0AAE3YMT9_9ACTN|nr:VOC family protein [Catenuloplanes atrovinosus]MDR7274701.1 catechol 2,3-dioxygenase-like lactoylglutathione lyase family enzyme [Catenuloplanes atrovinosus]
MATPWTVCFDAADPHRLAAFWAVALGYVAEPGYEGADGASIVDPDGRGPAIAFLRVPEGKSAKNRVHLDVRPAGPVTDEAAARGLAERLVARGATVTGEERYGGTFGHLVMRDPEGNEFCIA